MAQMNVSIPDGLKSWAESRVADGDYSSTSDYIRDLLRRDREYAVKMSELREAIAEGFSSGIDPREPSQIIEDIIAKRRNAA